MAGWDDIPDAKNEEGWDSIPDASRKPVPKSKKPVPQWLDVAGETGELAAMTYGGIKGGAAGLALGGPVGAAIGALAGTGLAYAGAKGLRRRALEVGGYEEPKPIGEEMAITAMDVPVGAAYEAIGGATVKVAGKLIAPFAEKLATVEGKELLKTFSEYGIKPLPGELNPSSKTFGIMESVLGYRPLSGDVMMNRAMKNVELLLDARNQLIAKKAPSESVEMVGKRIKDELTTILEKHVKGKVGKLNVMVENAMKEFGVDTGTHEAGTRWIAAMEKGRQAMDATVKENYKNVATLLPDGGNAPIPAELTEDLGSVAQGIFEAESKARLPLERVKKMAGKFKPEEVAMPEGVDLRMLEKDPELAKLVGEKAEGKAMSWNSLDHDQSVLGDKIRTIKQATGGKDTKETHALGELRTSILETMEKYAKESGDKAWAAYQTAKGSSAKYHDIFDKDILRIMNKHPEDVADAIIKSKKDSVTYLRQIQMATGDEGLQPLREATSKKLFNNSMKEETVQPNLLKQNWSNIPKETKDILFTKDQQKVVDNIIKQGQTIESQIKGTRTVEFIDMLMGTSNHKIVNTIVNEPGNTYFIRTAKRLLPPERMAQVEAESIERVLKMSGLGEPLPVSSVKEFGKYQENIKALMTDKSGKLTERYYNLQKFMKIGLDMRRAQDLARNASQTGQVLLGSQIGSKVLKDIASLSIGAVSRGTGAIILPWGIAKIYTSDLASRYFTRAIGMNPASKEAISLFAKSIALVSKENIIDKQEPQEAMEE